jgi:hypothetical protein
VQRKISCDCNAPVDPALWQSCSKDATPCGHDKDFRWRQAWDVIQPETESCKGGVDMG